MFDNIVPIVFIAVIIIFGGKALIGKGGNKESKNGKSNKNTTSDNPPQE